MTTVDQQTGERPDGNEPLVTLAKFRRDASGKIMFGQNLVAETTGDVRVGDQLDILETGKPNMMKNEGVAISPV